MRHGNTSYEFLLGLYEAGSDLRALVERDQRYPFRAEGVRGDVLLCADNVIQGGQLASPVIGLTPVLGNRVVCVRFIDPQYPEDFIFPARRLKNAVEAPRVLKPGDLSHQENRNWRPQIGMVRSNTVASLEMAGHRMLGHHLPRDRSYGNVPPPQHQYGQHNRSQSAGSGPHRGGYVPFQQQQQGYQQNYNQGYQQGHNQGYQGGQNRSGYGQTGSGRFGNQDGYQNQRNQGYQNRQGGGSYSSGYNNQGGNQGGYQRGQNQGYNSHNRSNSYQGQGQRDQGSRHQSSQGRSTWR
ncbi:hypothetical protein O0L34_g4044 [Tuta absoluta]|nr:hypothetical protein O0L34_g4044 [Tuta absoluta]